MINRLLGKIVDPHLREVLAGSALGLMIKVLAAASSFVMNIAIARVLGPSEAGLFFLGFTLVTLLAALGQMGLNNTLVRFVANFIAQQKYGLARAVVRKGLIWAAVLCCVLSMFGWISTGWLTNRIFEQPGFDGVLTVMWIALPLVGLYILCAQALQGLKQVAKAMVTLNVIVPVLLVLGVLMLPVETAVQTGWLYVGASLVALCSGVLWWQSSAPKGRFTEDVPSKQILDSCLPLWGVVVLNQLISWSSQLLLGVNATADEVALFAVAQRTAMLTSFVLVAVNAIAAPKFAAMYSQGDMDGLRNVALWSVRLMLLAAVPALAFMLAFPEWLMGLFGEAFRAGAAILVILAIGQFVNIATGSVGFLLSMTGHERVLRSNVLIGALLAVGLGLWTIPAYGAIGGAVATAVAVASQNLLGVYQVNRLLGFNTLAVWRKI
jgi:O-antigen/teichoic acid export membrane protein